MSIVSPVFRVLSVDPGNNMGICVAEIRGDTGTLLIIDAITVVVDKALKFNGDERWNRFTKQELAEFLLDDIISELLHHHSIDAVIYEGAYHAASLNAYESLLFYGRVITKIAKEYDWDILIESKTPSNVKRLNGAKGDSGDKTLMTRAVRANPRIIFPDTIKLDDLTEHAIDAIGIAYCVLHDLVETLPPPV